jgi:hypothetical protein
MKAWVITWEGTSQKLNDENGLVALLASRKSVKYVGDLVEFIYLRATSSASDMLFLANRSAQIPYKADRAQVINGVPHGDRVICGHNPWLYARKVSCVKVTKEPGSDNEEITWKEPPIFKWKDKNRRDKQISNEGEVRVVKRMLRFPLSNDLRYFHA